MICVPVQMIGSARHRKAMASERTRVHRLREWLWQIRSRVLVARDLRRQHWHVPAAS